MLTRQWYTLSLPPGCLNQAHPPLSLSLFLSVSLVFFLLLFLDLEHLGLVAQSEYPKFL